MRTEPVNQAALAHILRLREPWKIKSHRFDPKKQQLDVWIAPAEEQNHWLRGSRQVLLVGREQTWRHLDTGGWHTFVHVTTPEGYSLAPLNCAGEPGEPFSRGMVKFLFELLYNGVELGAICSLFSISLDQLWRFKFALDNGRVSIDGAQARAGKASSSPTASAANRINEPDRTGTAVPDPSEAVWKRLAMGDLNIDIRVLSLKLLLTRVRSQMSLIKDDHVRELKAAELHRYFNRNARLLAHELSQLQEVAR
ncbi:hypothetical protein [Ottowia sp.]|uniref:hypothetical protein n=1 Tax=Ottowia sp. TaxID=1898956 RepID=UPI002CAE39A2|nr:hypothetical protein [Ottowia sp.]HOB65848.1 hypothetical protein [Ottowia sp.]HPZ58691.1 hypothetical protein [Ottowia sp.]HQD46788.1 hypothetical protein [Ottowia sp.]